ncbi:MAG: Uma2 family endonuclease [Planctomycetota bacterium]|nr:MAG: Uma2 family endonuclease [Planctomycetota bacterium]
MPTADFMPAALPAPALVSPTPQFTLPSNWSLADLQDYLGGVALERILVYPPPGLATVEHALWLDDHEDRVCELIDGILVEKPVGLYESVIATLLASLISDYLKNNPRGIVSGEAGQLYILPNRMRVPDVAFISWDRLPAETLTDRKAPQVAPDLAVEVTSEGNTPGEMQNKLDEYFQAGVRLVWYIYPRTKTAHAYTARNCSTVIDDQGMLDGGEVLPGFAVRLGELFERAARPNAAAPENS